MTANDKRNPVTPRPGLKTLERTGFRLGQWTVRPIEGRVENAASTFRLSPKSMDVLLCLASTPRRVFTREELLQEVWGPRAVSDEPLTRCISELRRRFGDSRTAPQIIETISKRGYRLIATVAPLGDAASETIPAASRAAGAPASRDPADEAPGTLERPRTADKRTHNLPVPITSFVGRQSDLARLVETVRANRLVTLTGPGGTGKTRLALESAAELLDHFEPVCFVSLSRVTKPDDVAPAISGALDLHDRSAETVTQRLVRFLSDKRSLVVLDNFEHVIAAAPRIAELIQAIPTLHLLVTSRQLLRLRAERQFPVAPLDLPAPNAKPDAKRVGDYEAVRLFTERAQAVRPDFRLDKSNADDVAAICRSLDGLPLAIELAAARVRLFSPARLRTELEAGNATLGTGPVDAPDRHRTLTETVAWSFDLLREEEQVLFRRLAVFVGGRSIDAVERVCLHGLDLDAATVVESFADKSLVRVVDGRGGDPRLVMLETLHRFARKRLIDSGELEVLRQRHAQYFADIVEEAESELRGTGNVHWTRRLEDERPNLAKAIEWSFDCGENVTGLRIVAGLRDFWFYQSHILDMNRYCQLALKRLDEADASLRAGVMMTAGFCAYSRYEREAVELLEQAAALYETVGDKEHQALARVWASGSREMHDKDLVAAREGIRRGLELAREANAPRIVAQALNYLGEIERFAGNFELARDIQAEGLELSRATGEIRRVAMMTHNLAWIARHLGDEALAERRFRESLGLAIEHQYHGLIAEALFGMADTLVRRGKHENAALLIGFAQHQYDRMSARPQPADAADHDRVRQAVRERLSEKDFQQATTDGAQLGLAEVIALTN